MPLRVGSGPPHGLAFTFDSLKGGQPESSPESLKEGELMEAGKRTSSIAQAIQAVESASTAEIRVHITRRWFEPDPYGRALRVFFRMGMWRTRQKNAVLIYLNLRRKKFAIVADEGLLQKTGQKYWDHLGALLKDDLLSTFYENAIVITITTIGFSAKKHFPLV
jgi:uncharacterized membrane protein